MATRRTTKSLVRIGQRWVYRPTGTEYVISQIHRKDKLVILAVTVPSGLKATKPVSFRDLRRYYTLLP